MGNHIFKKLNPNQLLFKGAVLGDEALVIKAIEEGADVNVLDTEAFEGTSAKLSKEPFKIINLSGITALTWSICEHDKPEARHNIVSYLIKSGADIHRTNTFGRPSLFFAIFWHHPAIVKTLLNAGIDISHADEFGDTALHIAAGGSLKKIVKIVKVLLEHKPTLDVINIKNKDGKIAEERAHLPEVKNMLTNYRLKLEAQASMFEFIKGAYSEKTLIHNFFWQKPISDDNLFSEIYEYISPKM